MPRSLAEHEEIIETIKAEYSDKANEVSHQHIMIQIERFNDPLLAYGMRPETERLLLVNGSAIIFI